MLSIIIKINWDNTSGLNNPNNAFYYTVMLLIFFSRLKINDTDVCLTSEIENDACDIFNLKTT